MYTADWSPLGKNIFYRKVELFSMQWNCNFSPADYLVASGQNGGPIALIRNDKRGLRFVGVGDQKQIIYIYSASGALISSFLWNSGPFLDFGWSTEEDLVCVQENGTALIYDIFGNFCTSKTFAVVQEASKDFRVLECRFFTSQLGTGLAVLGSNYKIYYVTSINDPRRKLVEIPGLDGPPTCWDVVSGQDRELMFLVARDTKLHLHDPVERKTRTFTAEQAAAAAFQTPPSERKFSAPPVGPASSSIGSGVVEFNSPINSIVALAVSMNQQHLALLADTGALWIGSIDLQRKYCEFDTKSKTRPQQLIWCGNGAVVGYWQNILLVVGPERDWLNFVLDSPSHLVPELDGIRIIGSLSHELLHRVPEAITDIFKIASLEPGALLMEASKEFRNKSPKADEYLRMVREKNQLELAVNQCIEAAGHELDPQKQKELLRAASFGKCFLPEISSEPFVTSCRWLRVLNAMRVHTIGLPLTWTQLENLTVARLVDRLVRRRHYFLAIQICQYLGIPESQGSSHVLSQWALYKVENCKTNNPAALAKEIADKLGHAPGVSYSAIAAHAQDLGNPQLAIKLLDFESRAAEQVPLLAKLKQDHQAMEKAIESGDSDLVYYVMFELGDPLTNFELFDMIHKMPVALTLYLKYCRETDLDRLLRTYYQNDNFAGQALCHWLEAYSTQIVEKRISCLKEAADNYKRAKQDFLSTQTEEHFTLLSHQLKLEAELPAEQFVGLSLQATLGRLLRLGRTKLAESLRREFHVPERRMAWLKVRILTEIRDWEELGKMAKAKKSPIGFEPFVDAYLSDNNKFEAQKLMPKVKEENKVKYLIKVGMLEEAAKLGFQQKDDVALAKVYAACLAHNRGLAEKVGSMRAQLTAK